MTESVSLDFLAKQMQRMLDKQGALEDQITVLTGMAMRHDGALNGLAVEIQGLVRLVARLSHRVDRWEEAQPGPNCRARMLARALTPSAALH